MLGFLKCDAAGCDHTENHDDLTEDMVGKPCPKCGANLLTREDYDEWISKVQPFIAAMESLGILARVATPGAEGGKHLRLNLHDGHLNIRAPL